MNKYIELKEYLKKEGHLQKYLDNMKNDPTTTKGRLSKFNTMNHVLSESFDWENSFEGDSFWRIICNELEDQDL